MKEVKAIMKDLWPDLDECSLLTNKYIMEVLIIEVCPISSACSLSTLLDWVESLYWTFTICIMHSSLW